MPESSEEAMRMNQEIEKLFNPNDLTTPTEIDDNITAFCKAISDNAPVLLNVEPENWSRQSCCDLNVKKYIEEHGGKILFGYKVWYNKPNYIEGERHAVWQADDGTLKDVTFNADGEMEVLFIPDRSEMQTSLEANKQKIRWGKTSKVKSLIQLYEQAESMIPMQHMADDVAWATAITYEQWLAGKRMSNMTLQTHG
ncbi:hypothetical protein VSP9026_04442 [Vibrio spartinae]|uniref:Uncharacterized protein n=2 Tax=Vibrio spartinae TaxID=1918945 RepID=A0A1N6MB14_9VIBR|nr:hypothetical protein VSP9026_04442 [Vibrio spartinae]